MSPLAALFLMRPSYLRLASGLLWCVRAVFRNDLCRAWWESLCTSGHVSVCWFISLAFGDSFVARLVLSNVNLGWGPHGFIPEICGWSVVSPQCWGAIHARSYAFIFHYHCNGDGGDNAYGGGLVMVATRMMVVAAAISIAMVVKLAMLVVMVMVFRVAILMWSFKNAGCVLLGVGCLLLGDGCW